MRAHLNFWTFLGMFAGLLTPEPLRAWGLLWCLVAMVFWGFAIVRAKVGGYSIIPVLVAALLVPACAASNKAAIYTEEGLRSAELGWDAYFNTEADRCEQLHEPKTPAMEACFGDTYDADAAVATAVQSAVALLRTYWRARAAGEKPDLMQILRQVQALFNDLPPQAKQYFDRVKGIP